MKSPKLKLKTFDPSELLDSPRAIAIYLSEVCKSQDADVISYAIGQVAKAKGMSEIAQKTGLSRQNLYRSLSGENKAEFATIVRVLAALGVGLEFTANDDEAA